MNDIERFLNIFNLKLIDKDIYNNLNQKVGEVTLDNTQININFKINNEINAIYNIQNKNVLEFNSNNGKEHLNGSIYFSNYNEVIIKLNYLKDNNVYEIMIKPNGKIFTFDLINDREHEVFEINPEGVNDVNNHNYHFIEANILHYKELKKSDDTYNEEITRVRSNNDTYNVEKITKNNGDIPNHIVYVPKKENYIIQSGFLMQSMDREIYSKINDFRNNLNRYETNLFDKLVSLSLMKYNNYGLYSLLGININNANYVLKDEIYNAFMDDKKDIVKKRIRR